MQNGEDLISKLEGAIHEGQGLGESIPDQQAATEKLQQDTTNLASALMDFHDSLRLGGALGGGRVEDSGGSTGKPGSATGRTGENNAGGAAGGSGMGTKGGTNGGSDGEGRLDGSGGKQLVSGSGIEATGTGTKNSVSAEGGLENPNDPGSEETGLVYGLGSGSSLPLSSEPGSDSGASLPWHKGHIPQSNGVSSIKVGGLLAFSFMVILL